MKSIIKFLRATLAGGILFLLPIVLLIIIFNKARLTMLKISAPLAKKMPDVLLFGLDGSNLLAIFLLIMICFISGLIFRAAIMRRLIKKLEENLLSYFPGYAMLKSITSDTLGRVDENNMKTILVQDGDAWCIGFLVEEDAGFATVFLPGAPNPNSGDVKIVPTSSVKKVNVPTHSAANTLKSFGKGANAWIRDNALTS
jgi:uncharacterized membrane protein